MKHIKWKIAAVLALASVASVSYAATGISVTSTGVATGNINIATTSASGASLEVSSAPRLVKKTDNSVTLEWDKVATASAYIVKYSKTSVANSQDPNAQYDNESDQVTATGITIDKLSSTSEKLAPNTVYYFSVVAVDKDGKESDTFSDELAVTTDASGATMTATEVASATGTAAGLAVSDVSVVNNTTVAVVFNAELSADALKAKIVKTSDNSDVAIQNIVKDPANPKAATITLTSALSPVSSYTLTVIAAKDTLGNNIKEGVNGLKEFTTPETMAAGSAIDASGATLSGSLNPADSTKVATGAKENLLIVAALLLSFGIVYIYRRKLV